MRRAFFLVVILFAVLGLGALLLWHPREVPSVDYSASVVDALASNSNADDFKRALSPRPFIFPEDAGPHREFQTEWWYFTGNLKAASGAHFGYQLTVFRRALTAHPSKRKSDWAASQIYFAHFALTDVDGKTFHSAERWNREALGLAGARAVKDRGLRGGASFDAWVESWSARADDDGVHLVARDGDTSIDLHVMPSKAVALQGDHGLSHKSMDKGNASYYYSITRMATRGTVTTAGRTMAVNGTSWLDREWSTSALSEKEAGWDWFSLQLADGRDIMLYQMRLKNGGVDAASNGSIIDADGHVRPLALNDFTVTREQEWTSPHSGARYPAQWRIQIPSEKLDLHVEPWLPDQELQVSFQYWEGAVRIRDAAGKALGDGYVELTGYAQ